MRQSMASKKTTGWERRLLELFDTTLHEPFQWGVHDCCGMMADAVMAMTGVDPIAWGRGTYRNKREAVQVLHRHFGVGLLDTFTRIFHDLGFHTTDTMTFGTIGCAKMANADEDAARLFSHLTMVTGFDQHGTVVVPGPQHLIPTQQYTLVRAWRL